MRPDILFWFYKEFDLCRSRLKRLRALNKEVKIYGLYGGPIGQADDAARKTADLLDDFYVYPHDRQPKWKWKHGDQLIAEWHKDRGKFLNWHSLFICQWDMLVMASQPTLFPTLEKDQVLVSGLRPVTGMDVWWNWSKPDNPNYLAFKKWMSDEYGMAEEDLMACLFIIICLPRVFLDKYVEIGHPMTGFLEYKIPSLTRAFGLEFCTRHNFEAWWPGDPAMANWSADRKLLAPLLQEVSRDAITKALSDPVGSRIFHPVSVAHEDLMPPAT